MPFVLVIMVVLNMIQANKDAARCKKADFKAAGCSVFVESQINK
jgi:hypothetical protein